MRIISGTARGLHLEVPRGEIRPTMDMVRGAIFSSLGEAVINARVLDLFAGCGSFGIEALSRGAASATFVESNRKHTAAITKNLAHTRLEGHIICSDVFSYIERASQNSQHSQSSQPPQFDLIFADPPYAKYAANRDYIAELCALSTLPCLLAPNGTLILECEPQQPHATPHDLTLLSEKRYGKTAIRYYIHQ